MKKIFSFAIMIVLALSLASPVLIQAAVGDSGPKDCCTLRQNMTWKKGNITGAAPDANCADTSSCTLTNGETIGPIGIVCKGTTNAHYQTGQWGMICLVNTITYITNWIFYLLMILVVIMFIAAGVIYLMAVGSPDKTKRAKQIMLYAVIGLVIALIAKLIPSVVKLIVGLS